MLSTIGVKNTSGGAIFLTRIGLSIGAGVTVTVSNYAYEHEIKADESLLSFIQAGTAVLVIDLKELPKSDSLRFFVSNVAPPNMPTKAVSDTNIASLSGIPANIDDQVISAGDPVLLTGQSTLSENGPWIVSASAWTRPPSFPSGSSISGAVFEVLNGTVYDNSTWVCDTPEGSDIVGVSDLFFFQKISEGGDDLFVSGIILSLVAYNSEYDLTTDFLNVTVV